ncbi:type 4a pilus biogenesis protein PilO [Anaeroselena agilis]|uniref:Type 4a pilus biogenesis protein PilO n=1 Tax=Anaeroselena agilis TaxID=3063788 RepID=A0ABU3NYC7_9FIRM|nr:type 4a pilus biogenesis protein PilO [Selenomonadales bacterium 4137-cl]
MAISLPKELSLKHKLMLFALVALLIFAAAWLFLLQPQRLRLAELDGRYRNEKRQVDTIEAHALAHPDPAKHMAELDARRRALDRMLPETPGVSDFLVAVEKAARASGVQIMQVKPAPVVSRNGYHETPLDLLVRGDFFQTVGFLKRLEDAPRFNSVPQLTMDMKPGGGLETKLQVVIYSVKK